MKETVERDRIVCFCREVTEGAILKAIREGARTLQDIRRTTGACTGSECVRLHPEGRCCAPDIIALLERGSGRKVGDDCG